MTEIKRRKRIAELNEEVERLESKINKRPSTTRKVMRMWIKHARRGIDLHRSRL